MAKEFHHHVYVVLLDARVAKHRSVLRVNPKRIASKPCVYVGMSGLPPEHRFENHKNGYKAAWVVKKYGQHLMPELYKHLNPMPYEAALQMEQDLARRFAQRRLHRYRRALMVQRQSFRMSVDSLSPL